MHAIASYSWLMHWLYIANASVASNDFISLERKRAQNRYPKDCPYPGCTKKRLVKLSEHLMVVHNVNDISERKRFLQKAKEVAT